MKILYWIYFDKLPKAVQLQSLLKLIDDSNIMDFYLTMNQNLLCFSSGGSYQMYICFEIMMNVTGLSQFRIEMYLLH